MNHIAIFQVAKFDVRENQIDEERNQESRPQEKGPRKKEEVAFWARPQGRQSKSKTLQGPGFGAFFIDSDCSLRNGGGGRRGARRGETSSQPNSAPPRPPRYSALKVSLSVTPPAALPYPPRDFRTWSAHAGIPDSPFPPDRCAAWPQSTRPIRADLRGRGYRLPRGR